MWICLFVAVLLKFGLNWTKLFWWSGNGYTLKFYVIRDFGKVKKLNFEANLDVFILKNESLPA